VRAHGFYAMVAGQALVVLDHRQRCKASLGAVGHRDRDHAVEREHRVRRDALQQGVQRDDLGSIGLLGGGSFAVHGRDCGLELVGPDRCGRRCVLEEPEPLFGLLSLP
jgi:hypothetical protein